MAGFQTSTEALAGSYEILSPIGAGDMGRTNGTSGPGGTDLFPHLNKSFVCSDILQKNAVEFRMGP